MSRRSSGRPAVRLLILVGGFAIAGVLAGVAWEWLWTPPYGVVENGAWRPQRPALEAAADGTVLFVLIGAAVGLVGGGAAALLPRAELVTLLGVVIGTVLATGLMWFAGTLLAPPDPTSVASAAEEGVRLPGTLRVEGLAPFVALPGVALLTLTTAYILFPARAAAIADVSEE